MMRREDIVKQFCSIIVCCALILSVNFFQVEKEYCENMSIQIYTSEQVTDAGDLPYEY